MTDQRGFTLLEVMIAMTIFAVFTAVYVTSQGYNLTDSTQMREEMMLTKLCETKLNEIIVNPPEFKKSLTVGKTEKTFEDYENYKYIVEYTEFKIPDLAKIQGKDEGEEDDSVGGNIQQTVMKNIKKNMEKMIWQVKVTVINKETEYSFSLSSWLMDHKAKIALEGI